MWNGRGRVDPWNIGEFEPKYRRNLSGVGWKRTPKREEVTKSKMDAEVARSHDWSFMAVINHLMVPFNPW